MDSKPYAIDNVPEAIILAGGQGKRMGDSQHPKVLFEVAGRPMLHWVVDACLSAGVGRCIVVVGVGAEHVRRALEGTKGCEFVEQHEQLGTGHATQMAAPLFADLSRRDVFVLAGDGPLIRPGTLDRLLNAHRAATAAATLATALLDDPTDYGRIVRNESGEFEAIIEQRDATELQLQIREINPSYYCFTSDKLFNGLSRVGRNNRQGEFYLTDVPAILKSEGETVCIVDNVPAEDVRSINTPQQLAEVDDILRRRLDNTPNTRRKRA